MKLSLLVALLCLLSVLPPCTASPAVVVILLPGTSLSEWQCADIPTLHRLMQTGSVAVMNTRTAHHAGQTETETSQAALLTLGAGARAAGTRTPSDFLPASSLVPGTQMTAAALFERRTGQKPPPGQAVCPDWPEVVAANRSLGYDLQLGSLADTLTAHGVLVASGGGPESDWLAAGRSGAVRRVTRLQVLPNRCLVWDAGPNLQAAEPSLADAAAQVTALGGRLVLVALPAGNNQTGNNQNRHLAAVLAWGPGVPAGLLCSPSTRRPGLVTSTDFAPSVAAEFGIVRSGFQTLPFGFAWSEAAAPNAVPRAVALNAESVRQASAMRLLPYLAAVLGVWIFAVTGLASRLRVPAFALLVPPAALAAALFSASAFSFSAVLLLLLAAASALVRFGSAGRVLALGSAAIVMALCADMVTGDPLMHWGLLGYSALEGARYYGLGNEAMGLLLGAALVAAYGLWQSQRYKQFVLVGAMLGIVLLLGSAGAKAGGVLVSLAVFGSFLFTVSGRRWTPKAAALLAAVLVTGLTVAALGDALHHGSRSHLGEAVNRIAHGGPGEAGDIVQRKLAVEGRLAYHSAWAVLLWLGLSCTAWLCKKAPADVQDRALCVAGSVGIAACLLLNDAGVVAAAIFSALLWSALMARKSLPVLEDFRTGRPGT